MDPSKDIYYYQPAAVDALSVSLAKAFEEMEQGGDRYIKSATINTIVTAPAGFDKKEVEDLIDVLSQVHPNRAFLIVIDENCTELKAEFSTRCHKISHGEHVCSEVIRLSCSSRDFSPVKSILRANFITGVPTELVLYEPKQAALVYQNFSDLCDSVLYASSSFGDSFTDLSSLAAAGQNLVDLDWVKLGAWREQVKDVFATPVARERLGALSAVRISVDKDKASSLLLAGWLAARLGLQLKAGPGEGLSYSRETGSDISLHLDIIEAGRYSGSSGNCGLRELYFSFEKEGAYIKISRTDLLDTEIVLGEKIHTTRPLEDLGYLELVKRYFFVGESTINYRESLQNALKLYKVGKI